MSVRARLRCDVRELSGGPCEWCSERPGQELAHIHSIGAGGRKSADEIGNCFWACHTCARMSDGLFATRPDYVQAHILLFGKDWEDRVPPSRIAYERAVALTEHVRRGRLARGHADV